MNNKQGVRCRLCFKIGFFHLNLFSTTQNASEAIREIFRCKIEETDSLPNHICVDCWMIIKTFHEFYRNVIFQQKKFLLDGKITIKASDSDSDDIDNFDNLQFEIENNRDDGFKHDDVDHHEGEVFYEELKTDAFGNDSDSFEMHNEDTVDDGSDPDFQNEDQWDSEDGDLDERKDLETSLIKRKRGRPKKIRSNEELEFVKAKRKNLRAGKMFKCPHCVKTFTRQHRVSIHIKLRHGFECTICSLKVPSQQKLKQHQNIHQDGFDIRLRQKLEEVSAIDTNDVRPDEREIIWNKFDLKCDECSVEFRALNEAQVHYLNAHNNNRGYLKCCDIKLREGLMVKEHIAYHKNPDIYYCFICDVSIKLKSYLRNHLKNHIIELLENPRHVCDVCDKQFVTKSNLLYHKAEAHASEKIKCEVCSKTLFNEAQKEKHMRNAHETMSQQQLDYVVAHFDMSCDQCEVMFESFPHAKRHYLSAHKNSKGYIKCCNKKMKSLSAIDDHIQWHKNPESLRCPICDKLFNLKDHFKTHVRRHGKTFTCEICGKSFKRHTTLVGHRKAVHESGPRDYNCRFCSLRFLSAEKREGHEQLIHYGNTTGARIVCDICGKGFLQTSHLQKHIQAHHSGDPHKRAKKGENKSEMCTICGLWLSSRYRLKLHRKCHSMEPNRCQECGLEAPNHDALLSHKRAFHEIRRKHKCRLCDETFNNATELQEHGATHNTEKLYRCAYCLESFVWRASLDAHIKKSHLQINEGEKSVFEEIQVT